MLYVTGVYLSVYLRDITNMICSILHLNMPHLSIFSSYLIQNWNHKIKTGTHRWDQEKFTESWKEIQSENRFLSSRAKTQWG